MGMKNWRKWSAEKLSMRVFYALIAVYIVVFMMYWFVGYTRPFAENPNFNAPLFTDAVIILGYSLIIAGIGITVWAMVRSLHVRGKGENYNNNIPVKKINYSVAIGVLLLCGLTFLIGSSSDIVINGTRFTNYFWLKASDMFIYTSLILMIIAIAAVIYGATKYTRRK
jgi:H+/Cl- antiporter ClcA